MDIRTVTFPDSNGVIDGKNASRVSMPRLPWEPEFASCADRPETAPPRDIHSGLSGPTREFDRPEVW